VGRSPGYARPEKSTLLLGKDNRYVFQELLGMSDAEYNKYIDDGIIG